VPRPAAGRGGASGFSLVELLMVISILSLLVTMLLPSLMNARRLAQKVICLNNMRSVGSAAMLYAADNKDYVPWGNSVVWFQAFLPYLGSGPKVTDYRRVGIYRCPSYPDKRQTVCFVASAWSFTGPKDQVGFSLDVPRRLREIDQPSGTLYLTDNENGWWRQIILNSSSSDIDRQDIWDPQHLPTSTTEDVEHGRRIAATRHAEGCNGTFLDGHSAWIKATNMTVDMWRDKWK